MSKATPSSASFSLEQRNLLEQLNPYAAGIDVGAKEHWAGVVPSLCQRPVRCFGSETASLKELAQWLVSLGIKSVAMESTGIYWCALYDVLESHGLEVCLVNARHMKNVPGRKRDDWDSVWLCKLHSYGLLQASMIPASEIRQLRAYVRQRETMERGKALALQHMGKALSQLNITLGQWVSDLEGKTAMKIIGAIIGGEQDAQKLASFRHPKMKATHEELSRSLEGIWRDEYLFSLEQALKTYEFYKEQMLSCESRIEMLLANFPSQEAQTQAAIEAFESKEGFESKKKAKQRGKISITLI